MNTKKFLTVILSLGGLTAFYFAEALFFNGVLSFRDLSRYFYPLRFFTVNSIKSGIIPLWNPYIFCGTPHLALQQSAIFYPLSIIYYILPYDKAFNIFLVIHVFLGGTFVFFLCRQWKMREAPSLLAGITFMFSGYIVSVMNLTTTLSSVIWLPLILLFFDKALASQKLKYVFISAIFLGIMFLGGEPSIFYSTLWVLAIYAVSFWLSNRRQCRLRGVLVSLLIAIAAGILLSAFQLIPFLELMRNSDRALSRAPYEYLTKWSLSIKDTLSFVIPYLGRTDFSKDSYWKEQNWVILIYVGALAALLVIIALLFRKGWRVKFLAFIGILFLFISYGSHTPFYYFLYKWVPGFQFVRYPVRFLYVTTFAIAVLSGAGLEAYLEARTRSDERMRFFFKYLLIILYGASIIFLALHIYRNELIAFSREFCVRWFDPKTQGGILFSLIAAIINIKRFLGLLLAGGMALYLGLKLKIRQGIVNFAFISLVIADLFSAVPSTQITLDANSIRKTTPNIEYLMKDKSLFRFFVSPKTRESGNFLKGRTYEAGIQAMKDAFAANWPVIYGLYDVSGYDSIRLVRYSNLMILVDTTGSPSATRILDMLNEKYLIILNEIEAKGYRLLFKGDVSLYENTNVIPRAFLVSSYKVLKGDVSIADYFKSKGFDPAKEVILEEEPVLKALSFKLSALSLKEKVEITKYTPNEVVIQVTANSPKFLVLSDAYYPGWKAYIDGRRAKLYVADYILRAVHLDSGEHTVKFLFDPFSFKIGLVISALTLLAILCYINKSI